MNSVRHKPTVLLILDGFGHSERREANAIAMAHTPNWDRLWHDRPRTLLACSGGVVGLPGDQMGNSEVGHLHLGCGRLLAQDFTRINDAVDQEKFFANPALNSAVDAALVNKSALHIMGLLSPGGVHSHETHIYAMVEMAVRKGLERIYVHAFLDGRDVPPKSAGESIERLEAKLKELGKGRIVSLVGRFYAMDRDKRWDRVAKAFELIVQGKGDFSAATALDGLKAAYQRGETDEFVQATVIGAPVRVADGDAMVFMNFRADRAREITRAVADPAFDAFQRAVVPKLGAYVTLTEYQEEFPYPVAYPPESVANSLGEVLAQRGLTQLRLAETEKYAHVTFFFNGGLEQPFPGEERILVPSPKVKTYDMQPEMSAPEVTDRLVEAIESGRYDVIICNYANGDMVGHTGILDAAIKAVGALDLALGSVVAALEKVDGEMLVTSDHGNCEQMVDPETGEPHTAHTMNPVPLVYCGRRPLRFADGGSLADIAPTLLEMMGVAQPAEMNGRSLLVH